MHIDEITYLEYIDLITVVHSTKTKLACAVDGRIYTYDDVLAPLSVVDNLGHDRRKRSGRSDRDDV